MFKVHRSFTLSTGVKNNSIAVVVTPVETTVVYHNTVVFKFDSGTKAVTIRNGGYDTISTRTVINRALAEIGSEFSLVRIKGETMLQRETINGTFRAPFNGKAKLYPDGFVCEAHFMSDDFDHNCYYLNQATAYELASRNAQTVTVQ
jgi:hypothetical protein